MFCFHRDSPYEDEDYPTTSSDAQINTEEATFSAFIRWKTNVLNTKVQYGADLVEKQQKEDFVKQQNEQQALQGENCEIEFHIPHKPANFGKYYTQEEVEDERYVTDKHLYPIDIEPSLSDIRLSRTKQMEAIINGLHQMPPIVSYRNIQPWPIFWMIHSIDLLDLSPIPKFVAPGTDHPQSPNTEDKPTLWTQSFGLNFLKFMSQFQSSDGGFAGTIGHYGHVLISYAAVSAMVTVAARCGIITELHNHINIPKLKVFFLSMKITDPLDNDFGAFALSYDGEIDTRVVYCLLATCDLLGLLPDPEITAHVIPWLQRCQAHDGGFGAQPGCGESHGGYSSIALAAFLILEAGHCVPDLDLLEKWAVSRQLEMEGGFSGRTYKLVDACYAYWTAALVPLVHLARQQAMLYYQLHPSHAVADTNPTHGPNPQVPVLSAMAVNQANDTRNNITTILSTTPTSSLLLSLSTLLPPKDLGWVFDQHALQQYILIACQHDIGFADKPPLRPDPYHTCYALSGLSAAQVSLTFGKAGYDSYLKHHGEETDENSERIGENSEKAQESYNPTYNPNILDLIEQFRENNKPGVPIAAVGNSATRSGSTLLQFNNLIYNISQGAYRVVHSFNQYNKRQKLSTEIL